MTALRVWRTDKPSLVGARVIPMSDCDRKFWELHRERRAIAAADAAAPGSRPTEEWRSVAGFEGLYEVSNLGRVRTLRYGRVMAPVFNDKGYQTVQLCRDGTSKRERIHRLVAVAFVPGRNILHKEVAHLDGNRANPRADNLKWVSRAENCFHKRAHGTHQAGEQHPRAKLTEGAVRLIRQSAATATALARQLGVKEAAVRKIRNGERWRHV